MKLFIDEVSKDFAKQAKFRRSQNKFSGCLKIKQHYQQVLHAIPLLITYVIQCYTYIRLYYIG